MVFTVLVWARLLALTTLPDTLTGASLVCGAIGRSSRADAQKFSRYASTAQMRRPNINHALHERAGWRPYHSHVAGFSYAAPWANTFNPLTLRTIHQIKVNTAKNNPTMMTAVNR